MFSFLGERSALPASFSIPRPVAHDGVRYSGTHAGFLGSLHDPVELGQVYNHVEVGPRLNAAASTIPLALPDDVSVARLQARLVYIDEYNYVLGDIRADRLPALEGDDTLWRLGFKQKLSTNESKAKTMQKDIGRLWKKIIEEHPNTPWALLAQRESLYAMGLEWRASRD